MKKNPWMLIILQNVAFKEAIFVLKNIAFGFRTYRHVAYCNFVRWIWQFTGRKNRKILPACRVVAIRKKFPSQQYTGFECAT